jgi:hypothetical protein
MSLFRTTGFLSQENSSKVKLQEACQKSRKRHTITSSDLIILQPSSAPHLYAVNHLSRVVWAKAVCREFEEFFALCDQEPYPDEPLFFVTMTDVRCFTLDDPTQVDIQRFKKLLRAGLVGLSYLGVIEPALYVNIADGRRSVLSRGICMRSAGVQANPR